MALSTEAGWSRGRTEHGGGMGVGGRPGGSVCVVGQL